MTEKTKFSRKSKGTQNVKSRISTLILLVASLVMMSTVIYLVRGHSEPKPKSVSTISSQVISAKSEQPEQSVPKAIPMQEKNLDFDESLDKIGQVIVEKVGLDLPIVKGRGREDGSGFDKAIYACTNKTTQVLGVNNYVLSAHSLYDDAAVYFSPLLVYEDGSFDLTQPIHIEQLKLKIGDEIKVVQYTNQTSYRFKISKLFIDEGQGNFLGTYQAMSDIIGQPQVTLYTCSDVTGEKRLVIQGDFVDSSKI